MKKKIKIYLADLVHNYLGVGTYMFPLNIGYIAAFANKFFSKDIEIELFKYPRNFIDQFKRQKPDLVGFSNYAWNADLNNRIAQWIKAISPETIVVFGGPNIDYSSQGYKRFFSTHPAVDFYVLYQGEVPFNNLLKEIFNEGLALSRLKSKAIDGVIFYDKNSRSIIEGKALPRIKEVNTIPSPYLTGLLDKFFATNLIPIIETNRGCPYQCTYCCQGLSSHHKIEFFSLERVKEELNYVADRVKNTDILIFADSNFGIAQRDIEIAEHVAELMKKTDYPGKFNVNWAKNQPKIFEIAKILKNINLIISFQSLDETVLRNIKRQNIQKSVFKDIIDRVNREGGMSGTEIILALPGETKESHLKSLRELFNWNVSYIICYNCLILEGSEMSLQREKGEFECRTKFRLIDNSFGKYGEIMSFEAEEGLRSTSTMSEQQILYFRPVHWLIQFLWNYRFYYDLLKYLKNLEINPLDYITKLIDKVETDAPQSVKKIFREFKEEAKAEWFDSSEALRQHYSQPKVFDWLTKGNYGKMNSKYIFKILLEAKGDFEDYLYTIAAQMSPAKKDALLKIINFLSESIIDFRKDWREIPKEKTIEQFLLYLPEKQQKSLQTLLKQYQHKNKNVTLRKMSEFMDIRSFFYKVKT